MNKQVNSLRYRPDLSAAHEAYLKGQMKKVSCSFAAVVDCLEQPLGAFLTTAYLLCRVADNIEDCTETNEWRLARFNEFISLLLDPSLAEEFLLRGNRQLREVVNGESLGDSTAPLGACAIQVSHRANARR